VAAHGTHGTGFRAHGASRELFGNVGVHHGKLRAALDVSDRDREDPGALTREELDANRFGSDPLFAGDDERTRTIRATLQYRGVIDAIVHADHRTSDRTRTLLLAPGFGDRATRALETSGLGANVTRTIGLQHGRVVAGADLGADALHSAYDSIDGSGSRRRGAAFASGEWRLTPAVRLAAGARFDSIADSFEGTAMRDDAFSPRVGLAVDALDVTAYVQLSRAFKAPTLDQRFDQRPLPDFSGGTFTISNPALRAQRANNVEAGVRGASATHAWEVIGYSTTVDDEIDFDVRTFRYANIGTSRHRGIESMAEWTPAAGRRLGVTYTWTRATSGGRQLKNIAEHVVRADADLRTFLDVHVAVEHSANRWLDDENRIPLDDATVVDLRLARTFASLTAAVEATNLFDARYAPLGFALGDTPFYFPAAGRSLALTLTWKGAAP
jgi:outer membrane receptor protein involved in Fe transport